MRTRDKERLEKLEEEIQVNELLVEEERQLMEEKGLRSSTGFRLAKYKLRVLEKKFYTLARTLEKNDTWISAYDKELMKREKNVLMLEEQVQKLKDKLQGLMDDLAISDMPPVSREFGLASTKLGVAQRALANWREKMPSDYRMGVIARCKVATEEIRKNNAEITMPLKKKTLEEAMLEMYPNRVNDPAIDPAKLNTSVDFLFENPFELTVAKDNTQVIEDEGP